MEIQWALIVFTAVSGAGAWMFACAMIQHLWKKAPLPTKLESIVAFVVIAVGGCISILHLKHVDRILEALNHPTSGIFVEASLVGVLCVLIAVYFLILHRQAKEGACKALGIVIAVVGIVFSYACGASYMMAARPALATVATPLSYLGTAALAGAALNMLLKAKAGEPTHVKDAGLLTLAASALALALAVALLIVAAVAAAEFTTGCIVWIVLMLAAIAVAAFGAWKVYKSADPTKMVAIMVGVLVAALVAALAVRAVMWLVGTPVLDFFMMSLE